MKNILRYSSGLLIDRSVYNKRKKSLEKEGSVEFTIDEFIVASSIVINTILFQTSLKNVRLFFKDIIDWLRFSFLTPVVVLPI